MSYRETICELLDATPELANDARVVADYIGCHITTARRHIEAWENRRDWAMDAVAPTKTCAHCEHKDECRYLDALDLPVLCERVTDDDLELIELQGTLDTLKASRENGAHG